MGEDVLGDAWIGRTRFQLLRTQLQKDTHGKMVDKKNDQKTSQTKKQEKEEIASWGEEETRLQQARRKRGFFEVSL